MSNSFFDSKDLEKISNKIEMARSMNGEISIEKNDRVYNNSCDHWDCFGKCYCAQSWEK